MAIRRLRPWCLLPMLACVIAAAPPGDREAGDGERLTALEHALQTWQDRPGIPGMSAAIVQFGRVTWTKAFESGRVTGADLTYFEQPYKLTRIEEAGLSPRERAEVIEGSIDLLKRFYVFPDVAKTVEQALREDMASQRYESFATPETFVAALTARLQDLTHDKHLRAVYSKSPFRSEQSPPLTREQYEEAIEEMRLVNFGFERLERLPGNIGLVDIRSFNEAKEAFDTVHAAMTFLAHTDALIIDLRQNSGGSAATVALVASYLFDRAVQLNSVYDRELDKTTQFWTLPYVPGTRFGGKKPIYVLTSARTFSAGEALAYDLKVNKRATIVGETTRGGAHPFSVRRINDHFALRVPGERAVNPITSTNWEGTGVAPDVATTAALALDTAQLAALEDLLRVAATGSQRKELEGLVLQAEQRLSSASKSSGQLDRKACRRYTS